MTLKDLPIGKTATVTVVGGEGALRQHFLDMGIIPMADVTMVKYAPMGDPVEVRIHSYELTLRLADAAQIQIDNVRDEKNRNEAAVSGRFLIQVWARAVNIMKKQMNIPFRIVSFLPLRWQETRTAVKQPCLIS